MTVPAERRAALELGREVLLMISRDPLVDREAQNRAADLHRQYPSRTLFQQAQYSERNSLAESRAVLESTARMLSTFQYFEEGSDDTREAVRRAWRHFPDLGVIAELCGDRADLVQWLLCETGSRTAHAGVVSFPRH